MLESVLKTNAKRNSFHAAKNENKAVTAIAGNERGRMILQKVEKVVHPSKAAASSNSRGIVSNQPFSIQTQNGRAVT